MLRSLPKSNKHSWSSSPSLSVCVHRGESAVGSFFSSPFSSPKFHGSLYVEFYNGAQLWLAHALTILVFSVSSGWLRLLQQSTCFLADQREKKKIFHSPSVLFAWLVSSFSSFIRLTLEVFSDALDVQLRRRVRDADPENLNAAVSRALVLDEYDEADRRSGLSNTQAQRSTRHGTATPVHVTSPLTVDAAPPVVHSSPFSLPSPPPPPPSPPLTPVPPWSSTLLMREELCAPSQLDASVPLIV